MMTLYGYWRSSASYRVRIALHYKNISYQLHPVHLLEQGGEHHQKKYIAKNPQGLVPTLELEDGFCISQSLAIISFLEDSFQAHSLFPKHTKDKALVLSMAQWLVSEVQPLQNLRTLKFLGSFDEVTEKNVDVWRTHWISEGLRVLENMVCDHGGDYCFGNQVTLADVCLIPQLYSAKHYGVDLQGYPKIYQIEKNCQQLKAFCRALPELQPDAM